MISCRLKKNFDLIIPATCPGCHSPVEKDYMICPSCWKNLTFITPPFCNTCAEPLEISDNTEAIYICGNCELDPPKFSQGRALFKYSGLARQCVLSLKHGNATHLSKNFAEKAWRQYSNYINTVDIILPVPLHWSRLLKRGYNQASLLAKSIAYHYKKPFDPGLLIRKKRTPSQGNFGATARVRNVKSAFMLSEKAKGTLGDKTILLVDDVMASGATLNECSKVLLTAKAKEVKVLVMAKSTLIK